MTTPTRRSAARRPQPATAPARPQSTRVRKQQPPGKYSPLVISALDKARGRGRAGLFVHLNTIHASMRQRTRSDTTVTLPVGWQKRLRRQLDRMQMFGEVQRDAQQTNTFALAERVRERIRELRRELELPAQSAQPIAAPTERHLYHRVAAELAAQHRWFQQEADGSPTPGWHKRTTQSAPPARAKKTQERSTTGRRPSPSRRLLSPPTTAPYDTPCPSRRQTRRIREELPELDTPTASPIRRNGRRSNVWQEAPSPLHTADDMSDAEFHAETPALSQLRRKLDQLENMLTRYPPHGLPTPAVDVEAAREKGNTAAVANEDFHVDWANERSVMDSCLSDMTTLLGELRRAHGPYDDTMAADTTTELSLTPPDTQPGNVAVAADYNQHGMDNLTQDSLSDNQLLPDDLLEDTTQPTLDEPGVDVILPTDEGVQATNIPSLPSLNLLQHQPLSPPESPPPPSPTSILHDAPIVDSVVDSISAMDITLYQLERLLQNVLAHSPPPAANITRACRSLLASLAEPSDSDERQEAAKQQQATEQAVKQAVGLAVEEERRVHQQKLQAVQDQMQLEQACSEKELLTARKEVSHSEMQIQQLRDALTKEAHQRRDTEKARDLLLEQMKHELDRERDKHATERAQLQQDLTTAQQRVLQLEQDAKHQGMHANALAEKMRSDMASMASTMQQMTGLFADK